MLSAVARQMHHAIKSVPMAIKQSGVYWSFWGSRDELSSSLDVRDIERQEAPDSGLDRLCDANFFGGVFHRCDSELRACSVHPD